MASFIERLVTATTMTNNYILKPS